LYLLHLIAPLQSLNSSAIRARERTEAEKFYLLEICKSLPSSAISSAASAAAVVNSELHPRFSELVSQHGLPIAASDAASVTLAASLAEVQPVAGFPFFVTCSRFPVLEQVTLQLDDKSFVKKVSQFSVLFCFSSILFLILALTGGSFNVDS
jgi:hypothetical protein